MTLVNMSAFDGCCHKGMDTVNTHNCLQIRDNDVDLAGQWVQL